MHKSAFCTFLHNYAQIGAFLQAILACKKAQKRTKKCKNAQKCTKARHFAQTHAIPPFIIPPLACTQFKGLIFSLACSVHSSCPRTTWVNSAGLCRNRPESSADKMYRAYIFQTILDLYTSGAQLIKTPGLKFLNRIVQSKLNMWCQDCGLKSFDRTALWEHK